MSIQGRPILAARRHKKVPGPRDRIVLIQGAFDILHVGHIMTFEFAKTQGDYLIVALNTNELIADYKQREAVMPWAHKKKLLEAIRYVDEVVAAREFSPLALLKSHNVNVYVVCQEWLATKTEEIAYMQSKGARVAVSPRFTDFGTRDIKARLLAEYQREIAA